MVGRRKVIASRNRRLISPLTAPAIGFLAGLEHSDTSSVASMARKRDVRIKAVRSPLSSPPSPRIAVGWLRPPARYARRVRKRFRCNAMHSQADCTSCLRRVSESIDNNALLNEARREASMKSHLLLTASGPLLVLTSLHDRKLLDAL